jgi:hypothetical protein
MGIAFKEQDIWIFGEDSPIPSVPKEETPHTCRDTDAREFVGNCAAGFSQRTVRAFPTEPESLARVALPEV